MQFKKCVGFNNSLNVQNVNEHAKLNAATYFAKCAEITNKKKFECKREQEMANFSSILFPKPKRDYCILCIHQILLQSKNISALASTPLVDMQRKVFLHKHPKMYNMLFYFLEISLGF